MEKIKKVMHCDPFKNFADIERFSRANDIPREDVVTIIPVGDQYFFVYYF